MSVAVIELLKILIESKSIDLRDWDRIAETLTDQSSAHEMKPAHRTSVEHISETLKRVRPQG